MGVSYTMLEVLEKMKKENGKKKKKNIRKFLEACIESFLYTSSHPPPFRGGDGFRV
jgi:hypothetical protein